MTIGGVPIIPITARRHAITVTTKLGKTWVCYGLRGREEEKVPWVPPWAYSTFSGMHWRFRGINTRVWVSP